MINDDISLIKWKNWHNFNAAKSNLNLANDKEAENMQKLDFSLSTCIIKIWSLNPNNTDQHYYSEFRIFM